MSCLSFCMGQNVGECYKVIWESLQPFTPKVCKKYFASSGLRLFAKRICFCGTEGHGYYYDYARMLEVDWPCDLKGKWIHHKDSTILNTQRQAQAWQAQDQYMVMYSRDRTEGVKTMLGHHPKGSQIRTTMEYPALYASGHNGQWVSVSV